MYTIDFERPIARWFDGYVVKVKKLKNNHHRNERQIARKKNKKDTKMCGLMTGANVTFGFSFISNIFFNEQTNKHTQME